LRHDIDFDLGFASEIAKIETELGIKSTFFVMLTNPFYNIFDKWNSNIVNYLMWREDFPVSLRFNPVAYDNPKLGFQQEEKLFREFFGVSFKIISIHIPIQEPLSRFLKVDHTYKGKWFRDIKYISDSKGFFREGNPFESDWFKEGKSAQVLLHPIWWMQEGNDVIDKLINWQAKKYKKFKSDIAESCKPYKGHLEGL